MNANRIKSHGLKDGALFEEKGFGRLFSKFLAVTISAVLVAATLPAPAFADARIEAASSIGLSTQAASKTVYVIASVKTTTSYDLGLLGSASSTTTASYAYNPQGLVASHTNKTGAVSAKTALTYTGDKIKSAKATVAGATSSAVYTYGASGQITKATTVSAAAANGAAAATAGTVTPTYKSGKVTKLVSADKATANGQSADATTTTTFAYKSGRVSKSVSHEDVRLRQERKPIQGRQCKVQEHVQIRQAGEDDLHERRGNRRAHVQVQEGEGAGFGGQARRSAAVGHRQREPELRIRHCRDVLDSQTDSEAEFAESTTIQKCMTF